MIIRGGVYRDLVKPARAGVTIKAMTGEKVVVTGADEIVGWKPRAKNGSRLGREPAKLLRDGREFKDFNYVDAAKSIVVRGFDPRAHLMGPCCDRMPST